MQLVINTYGSYLRKKGNCFLVRKEDKVLEIIQKGFYPEATKNKVRCVDCTYRNICV